MSPQRSKKSSKASKKSEKTSLKPNVDVIQRRLRYQRVRTWLNQVKPDDFTVEKETDCDIVYSSNGKYDADEDRGKAVEITDNGLDESDEYGGSECSSIASGPSFLHRAKKLKTSCVLCSACRNLYERAKRTKAQIKNKLQDNDPQSLTCDQWMLRKKRMLRKVPKARRKGLRHVLLIKDREMHVGMGLPSTCSRPHVFLQRNLKRCPVVQANKKRKNTRKRTRNDSQDSRVVKQHRLQSNSHHELISISLEDSPNSWDSSSQEINNSASAEVIPSSITVEAIKQKDAGAKQEAPKKMKGFRDLLAQLRGNMIVREKRF